MRLGEIPAAAKHEVPSEATDQEGDPTTKTFVSLNKTRVNKYVDRVE